MIKVLKKAKDVLELVSSRYGADLRTLAEVTGLKKPGLFALLASLVELGLLEKTEEGVYVIGPAAVRIARPTLARESLAVLLAGYVRALAEELREMVVACALRGVERIVLARAEVQQSVVVSSDVGARQSLYETATGWVLAAYVDEAHLRALVARHGLPGERWEGLSDFESLQAALAEVRRVGFAAGTVPDRQVRHFAVPVFGLRGEVTATLGVSMPVSRLADAQEAAMIQRLKEAAASITRELRADGRPDGRAAAAGGGV